MIVIEIHQNTYHLIFLKSFFFDEKYILHKNFNSVIKAKSVEKPLLSVYLLDFVLLI